MTDQWNGRKQIKEFKRSVIKPSIKITSKSRQALPWDAAKTVALRSITKASQDFSSHPHLQQWDWYHEKEIISLRIRHRPVAISLLRYLFQPCDFSWREQKEQEMQAQPN